MNHNKQSHGLLPCVLSRPVRSALGMFLLPIVLAGCEAELNLAGVAAEGSKSSHRADYYQALASVPQATLLAGNNGVLLTSLDQGQSWTRQVIAKGASLIDLDACADGSFIALSFDNRLWHSADLGLSWREHALPTEEQMLTVACAPDGACG